MAERQKHVPRGPFHITPVFAASGKGAILEDVDGNRLIDLAAGIGVVNTGHAAESVVKAVQSQAERLVHGSFNVTAYEGYVRVAERLNRAAPGDFAKKTFLATTGAEAVENAVKIARAFTGCQAIVCFDHAFHGRTLLAMTLTAKAKPNRVGMGPFAPEVYRAPFPDVYRWPHAGGDAERVSRECFEQFVDLVTYRVGAQHTAAVIIEPVLGEGGFLPVPREFMSRLRKFCTDNNIVLIADEIQTGFGRTGTLFACEQLGIAPDLITTAKGLGGGLPISAVTGRAEIMDGPDVSGIGGTFNGNPLSCAAALAVFDQFERGDLLPRARALAESLSGRLRGWKDRFPIIGDVRGLGPMLAMELVKDRTTKTPDMDSAKKVLKLCYERGVVLMTAGTYGNVVRFLPPLVIEPAQLKEGLDVVEGALKELP